MARRNRERRREHERGPAPVHVATLSLPASSVKHERSESLLCRLKSRGSRACWKFASSVVSSAQNRFFDSFHRYFARVCAR